MSVIDVSTLNIISSVLNVLVIYVSCYGSIGRINKNDTPCEVFSDPIMVQLEELEGRICDILDPEALSHVKANISTVQATRVKETDSIRISKI